MKTLALLLLLAAQPRAVAQAPQVAASSAAPAAQPVSPKHGSVESSKTRLDAQDPAGALSDAETAIGKGGGADAYAARADAKRALGRPFDDFIADYAEAAKRDPRYVEKYEGLIAQRDSELHPQKGKVKGVQGESDSNNLAKVLGAVAVGILIFIASLVLLRGRAAPIPPAEDEPEKKRAPPEAS